LAADPGGATAKLLFVVGNHGKEDGAEIAIAEAALSHKGAVLPSYPATLEFCDSLSASRLSTERARWTEPDKSTIPQRVLEEVVLARGREVFLQLRNR
jgi:hypothetical protein